MRSFLAAVLSVIAVGVMLIAYGLFTSRATAAAGDPGARPMFASQRVGLVDDGYTQYPPSAQYPAYATTYAARPMAYPVNEVRQVPAVYETAYTALCHPATYWMTGNTINVDGGEMIVGTK